MSYNPGTGKAKYYCPTCEHASYKHTQEGCLFELENGKICSCEKQYTPSYVTATVFGRTYKGIKRNV